MLPTWPNLPPTWSQNPSKIDPRAIKNPFKISSCIWYLLGSIFDGFWLQLGTLEPSKNIENTCFLCFCDFCYCLLDGFWKPTWLHFGRVWGAKLAPSWHQIAPKIDPKIYPKSDRMLHRFFVEFCSNLVPTWPPTWGNRGLLC